MTGFMPTVSENIVNQNEEFDGFVSSNLQDIPVLGYLVQATFRSGKNKIRMMPAEQFVESMKEATSAIALEERRYLPKPKKSRQAFVVAAKNLGTKWTPKHDASWDGGRCEEKYEIEEHKGGGKTLFRVQRGTRDGIKDMTKTRVIDFKYSSDRVKNRQLRRWSEVYWKSLWTADTLDDKEREILSNWSEYAQNIIAVERVDGSHITSAEHERWTVMLYEALRTSMRSIASDDVRTAYNKAMIRFCGIPRPLRGQRFVPKVGDLTLPRLLHWAGVVDVFGIAVGASAHDSNDTSLLETGLSNGETTNVTEVEILGFMNDKRQIEYLKQDVTNHVNEVMDWGADRFESIVTAAIAKGDEHEGETNRDYVVAQFLRERLAAFRKEGAQKMASVGTYMNMDEIDLKPSKQSIITNSVQSRFAILFEDEIEEHNALIEEARELANISNWKNNG